MHLRFVKPLQQITEKLSIPLLRESLSEILQEAYFPAMLTAKQVSELQQQSGLERDALLLELLPLAAACARAKISAFKAGAIASGLSGNVYFGANMEYPGAAIGQTINAVQSAVSHAWMQGEKGIDAISMNRVFCGNSRQFLQELNETSSLMIHLPGEPSRSLADYLPQPFGPEDFAVNTRLFDDEDQGFTVFGDDLSRQAIIAANRSHTPYSFSPSGVAIETCQGKIYCGSYIENAAFNPSLPPLQVALNLLMLNGHDYQDIQRVILAENPNSSVRQWQTSLTVLHVLGCQHVEPIWLNL